MKTISRYIMTLALLITAVGGAWAEETLTETIITTGYSGSNLTVNGTYFKVSGTQFRSDGGYNGVRIANGKTATISLIDPNSSAKATKIVLYPDGGDTDVQYVKIDGAGTYSSTDVTVSKDVSITNDGSATISWSGNVNYGVSISKIEITYTAGPVVNINDAKTEASFEMPAFDATAEYELVRDMSVDVDATIADRIRIKKENNVYVVVTDGQLTPAVSDNISGTAVAMTATTDYTAKLQKKVEGDTPSWADAEALSVGTFRYVITGAGLYDGEITTNEFTLFEGYEVEVPAGEMITYYKDENLKLEENSGAQLYTITSVGTETATATELTVAKANMPILVKNNGQDKKTILLLPTTNQADEVTAAKEFVGTLVATTIPASTSEVNSYAFNGKQFVWVKNDLAVGANKAWLAIPKSSAQSAPVLNLVFEGDVTGISGVANSQQPTANSYYDLNGRKLQSIPTKKGIYILNGKKVVVK